MGEISGFFFALILNAKTFFIYKVNRFDSFFFSFTTILIFFLDTLSSIDFHPLVLATKLYNICGLDITTTRSLTSFCLKKTA